MLCSDASRTGLRDLGDANETTHYKPYRWALVFAKRRNLDQQLNPPLSQCFPYCSLSTYCIELSPTEFARSVHALSCLNSLLARHRYYLTWNGIKALVPDF